jgi:hypothetical protein
MPPITRALLALSLAATLLLPARSLAQVSVKTLQETLQGEVSNITATDVMVKVNGKDVPVKVELKDLVQINFKPLPSPTKDAYTAVELTDGSALRCKAFTIKKKEVTLTLSGGQELKVPIDAIQFILKDAHDPNVAKQFKEKVLAKPRVTDLILKRNNQAVNPIDGTIGDADDKGETIEFTTKIGDETKKIQANLGKLQGLVFLRTGTGAMKPAICKLYDTEQNVIMVVGISKRNDVFYVSTPSGAKLDISRDLMARLDYSKGKLTYLSALDPVDVKESSTNGSVDHYRRDKSFSETPFPLKLRLRKGEKDEIRTFDRGLALHSRTELEYDLNGEYREFKAVIGIDATLDAAEPTIVKIMGDGKKLYEVTLTPDDKKQGAQDVTLSVKNVKKLRLIVQSAKFLDLGSQALLAEARVSK